MAGAPAWPRRPAFRAGQRGTRQRRDHRSAIRHPIVSAIDSASNSISRTALIELHPEVSRDSFPNSTPARRHGGAAAVATTFEVSGQHANGKPLRAAGAWSGVLAVESGRTVLVQEHTSTR